ncbi:MAG: adenosylcobinamide-phosphate synthase CbiB [Ferrovibrio sp.]|uniref:adenosylcobinamide-phosphate synthase CbiB n=1 Tax=Ferrovibrio sp. TaxID=1917215 RepID=UPI002618F110|nr:adenosylcobinamide-phosphate synthase CbiB [Ferrovibrio sp.]MCW0232628.1 adenosylcobinamide-phosphate synthase CbiB [Ferrovibrio sp.]
MGGDLTVYPAAINLWLLVVALGIEALLGWPAPLYRAIRHPVVWIGALIGLLERHLNRPAWSDLWRRLTGLLALALLLLAVWYAASLVRHWLAVLLPGDSWIVEAVFAASLLAQRSLWDHVVAVARGLEDGGIVGGREAVAMIVGRDPESLDEAGVSRAAIESLAENFSDGVVAPAFWLAIGGLPGIALYKAINTADSMIGHKSDRYRAFGWAAARLDDLVNLPASRLSALLLVLAAAVLPGASAGAAFAAVERDAGRHRSPNAGWPEAAMAGALGLRLAGPRRYAEGWVEDHWMGDGRSEATATDIRRALKLYAVAGLLLSGAALLGAIALL